MSEPVLRRYMEAWSNHDVQSIMSMMTEDCIFRAASGPEIHGKTHVGAAEVESSIRGFFTSFPDAEWSDVNVFAFGAYGYSEWTLKMSGHEGSSLETRGCDFFELVGDKIHLKSAFRKQRI